MSSSSDDISSDSDLDELVDQACNIMKSKLQNFRNSKNTERVSDECDSENDSDSDESDDEISGQNVTRTDQTQNSSFSDTFVIDKEPNLKINESDSESINLDNRVNIDDKKGPQNRKENTRKKIKNNLTTSLQTDLSLEKSYFNMDIDISQGKKKEKTDVNEILKQSGKDVEIMKKSVITPDFEKKESIPPYEESMRQLKKQRKIDREKTKGKGWFEMPAPEMTEEKKNDLTVLHMRRALDPKRFYKGNDIRALPKYFQFGRVIEGSADFYHSRIPKKQRKSTMVDELLADAEFRRYNKRKYVEIQEARQRGAGPYKHMKRLKKKKK